MVLGAVVGLVAGGFTMAVILGTAFINYSLHQDEVKANVQAIYQAKTIK